MVRGLRRPALVDGAARPEGLAVCNLPSAPSGAGSGGDGRRLIRRGLHPGMAGADHVDAGAPAARAAPAQLDQRHVTAAGVDQGLQVRVTLMATRPAGQHDAHVACGECGPWRRQPVSGMAVRSASVARPASIRSGAGGGCD